LGIAFTLVLLSGALHSVWNLFTKRSGSKDAFLWHSQWVSIIVFLPLIYSDARKIEWGAMAILLIGLSMILHAVYTILLAKAYTVGDLSQVYPIMRGTSPLIVPIVGILLLGESLSLLGWLGILIIIGGIVTLSRSSRSNSKIPTNKSAVLYAFAIGVCIASYIVVDKLALTYVPLFALNAATNVGNLIALTYFAQRSGQWREEWRVNRLAIVFVGVIAPGGYLLFLQALSMADVAALAPMREIGTAFGAMLGVWLLKESNGSVRIPAAILITIGVIIIGIYH